MEYGVSFSGAGDGVGVSSQNNEDKLDKKFVFNKIKVCGYICIN